MRHLASLMAVMVANQVAAAAPPREARSPAGYNRGRCLYVVDGAKRIAGPCFYKIEKDGSFGIDGPRQTFGGADTVDRGASALTYSRDWWAEVQREDGGWSIYGNEAIPDVHGGSPRPLRKRGACYVGEGVKLCLWRR